MEYVITKLVAVFVLCILVVLLLDLGIQGFLTYKIWNPADDSKVQKIYRSTGIVMMVLAIVLVTAAILMIYIEIL